MAQLSRIVLQDNHHLLRLKAKLQSVKWKGIPDEVKALVDNLTEMVTPNALGNGGYFNYCTIIKVDNLEFIRFVLGKKGNPEHVPTIEAFISPEGFVHFHVILTFVGDKDEEIDNHVARELVDFLCGCFINPPMELSIVIHRRWKDKVTDRKAPYTEALWGEEAAIKINKILILKQQEIARLAEEERRAVIAHNEQLKTAGETNPKKDINA